MLEWKIVIAAVGLVFVIEGVFGFALPELTRRMMAKFLLYNSSTLRQIGLLGIAVGLVVLWLASLI